MLIIPFLSVHYIISCSVISPVLRIHLSFLPLYFPIFLIFSYLSRFSHPYLLPLLFFPFTIYLFLPFSSFYFLLCHFFSFFVPIHLSFLHIYFPIFLFFSYFSRFSHPSFYFLLCHFSRSSYLFIFLSFTFISPFFYFFLIFLAFLILIYFPFSFYALQ